MVSYLGGVGSKNTLVIKVTISVKPIAVSVALRDQQYFSSPDPSSGERLAR